MRVLASKFRCDIVSDTIGLRAVVRLLLGQGRKAPIATSYIDNLLESLSLTDAELSELLGCDAKRLARWRSRGSALPGPEADLLADATGVPFESILEADGHVSPSPIWQKTRASAKDEVSVIAAARARILAARFASLQALMGQSSSRFGSIVRGMREASSLFDRPEEQAASAAAYFLKESGLDTGARPIGEVLRGFLRASGFVVLEIPIRKTKLEGFLTYVATDRIERPLIVANSYRTSWFRRNYVILHEVGHLLDLDASATVFDRDTNSGDEVEFRANLFALQTLIPRRLLESVVARGNPVVGADEGGMARLIAETHAEARHIARAAEMYGLVSATEARRLEALSVPQDLLVAATAHAASLVEAMRSPGYVKDQSALAVMARQKRRTEWPFKALTIPVPYVLATKAALDAGRITRKRAAELLMVPEDRLRTRFAW